MKFFFFFFHYKCRSSNGGIQYSLISQKGAIWDCKWKEIQQESSSSHLELNLLYLALVIQMLYFSLKTILKTNLGDQLREKGQLSDQLRKKLLEGDTTLDLVGMKKAVLFVPIFFAFPSFPSVLYLFLLFVPWFHAVFYCQRKLLTPPPFTTIP